MQPEEQSIIILCLTCNKEVAELTEDGYFLAETPLGATFFTATGNYGSPFDPINRHSREKQSLNLALCDNCLEKQAEDKKIVELTVVEKTIRTVKRKHYELES